MDLKAKSSRASGLEEVQRVIISTTRAPRSSSTVEILSRIIAPFAQLNQRRTQVPQKDLRSHQEPPGTISDGFPPSATATHHLKPQYGYHPLPYNNNINSVQFSYPPQDSQTFCMKPWSQGAPKRPSRPHPDSLDSFLLVSGAGPALVSC